MNYIQNDTELYHHGIKGQRWGQRNGPPYPLGYNQKSSEEKSFGARSGKNRKNNAYQKDRNQHSANQHNTNQHSVNQHIENQRNTNQQEHEARDLDYRTSKKIISLYERRAKLLSKQDKTEEKIKKVDSKIDRLNKKLGDGIKYYIVQNDEMDYSNKDKEKNYVTIIQPKSKSQIEAEVRARTLKNTKKIAKDAQDEVDRIAKEYDKKAKKLDKEYRQSQNQYSGQSSNNKRTITKGRSISSMTDQELQDYVNRLDWENKAYAQEMQPYNDMNKFVLNTMNDLGTVYNFVETIGRFQAKEYDFTKNPSWTRKTTNNKKKNKNKNNNNDINNKGNNS